MERPAHDRAELVEGADLVRPLRHRAGQADEVAGEQRIVVAVAPVLLAGGDHERRAVGLGVGEVADGVAEPGRGVQVEEGGPAR